MGNRTKSFNSGFLSAKLSLGISLTVISLFSSLNAGKNRIHSTEVTMDELFQMEDNRHNFVKNYYRHDNQYKKKLHKEVEELERKRWNEAVKQARKQGRPGSQNLQLKHRPQDENQNFKNRDRQPFNMQMLADHKQKRPQFDNRQRVFQGNRNQGKQNWNQEHKIDQVRKNDYNEAHQRLFQNNDTQDSYNTKEFGGNQGLRVVGQKMTIGDMERKQKETEVVNHLLRKFNNGKVPEKETERLKYGGLGPNQQSKILKAEIFEI